MGERRRAERSEGKTEERDSDTSGSDLKVFISTVILSMTS